MLKKYLETAQRQKWAIGQFNFSNLETLKAIIQAAEKLKSPVIIGTSEKESRFLGLKQAVALVGSFKKKNRLPIFLNLDHGKTLKYIKEAIDAGYDSVNFDGSELSLEQNIKKTKEIVKYAKKFGVLVEGAVGVIGGNFTDINQALRFIKETKVDSLALAIGSIHGIEISGNGPRLNLNKLKEIKEKLKNTPLVLHGGSGIRKEDVKKGIKLGIVKININTKLRVTYTDALKKILKNKPKEKTPYKYMPKVIEAIQKVVEEKIKLFGSVAKI